MPINIPTTLTWLRILLIPVFVGVYYLPDAWLAPAGKNWLAMSIFAVAAITDWLDGWLARRLGLTSAFGAFLDPVADKLVVAVALVLLLSKDLPSDLASLWHMSADRARMLLALTAIVIIGREIAISALREWMAELGQRGKVAVSAVGKYKTILQIIGLSMMLFRWDLFGIPIFSLGALLTVLAAAFTLVSMFSYLRAAWPELKRQ